MKFKRLPYLPNLLSSLRIALAPAMLGAAYSNSKVGFTVLLVVALMTDWVDGVVARRWKAVSELGRRLDHWGDGLTTGLGALGLFFLWPLIFEREWRWALVALAGYAMVGVQRLIDPPTAKHFPRWPAKLMGWVVPLSLVPLISDGFVWPFYAAAAWQAVAGTCKLMGALGRGREAAKQEGVASKPER